MLDRRLLIDKTRVGLIDLFDSGAQSYQTLVDKHTNSQCGKDFGPRGNSEYGTCRIGQPVLYVPVSKCFIEHS